MQLFIFLAVFRIIYGFEEEIADYDAYEELNYVAITSGTCESAGLETITTKDMCKAAVSKLNPDTFKRAQASTSMYNGCFTSLKSGKSYFVTDKPSTRYKPSNPNSKNYFRSATKDRKVAGSTITYYCIKEENEEEFADEVAVALEDEEEVADLGAYEELTYVAVQSGTCEDNKLETITTSNMCKVAVSRLVPGTYSRSMASTSMYNGCFTSKKSGRSYYVTDKISRKYKPSDPDSPFRYKSATTDRKRAGASFTYYCIKDDESMMFNADQTSSWTLETVITYAFAGVGVVAATAGAYRAMKDWKNKAEYTEVSELI